MSNFCINRTSDSDIIISKDMAIFAILILFVFSLFMNICCVCCVIKEKQSNLNRERKNSSSRLILN